MTAGDDAIVEKLAAIRATDEYQGFLRSMLEHSAAKVAEAQHKLFRDDLELAANKVAQAKQALAEAEEEQRVQAALAVAHGYPKVATAAALGASRPTLDAWLTKVTPDMLESAAGRKPSESQRTLLGDADGERRTDAVLAVRGGFGKVATAVAVGVTLATLEMWLDEVETDADLRERVEQHEAFVVRYEEKIIRQRR